MGNASRTSQLGKSTPAQPRPDGACCLRWVSTRGDKCPWSEPVSATIPE
jgi:hypothetical protein